MYKRVDIDEQESIDGFSYNNYDGDLEIVKFFGTEAVTLVYGDSCQVATIYIEDIPKLVKALEAAYEHIIGK